jgi:hypothetical protein
MAASLCTTGGIRASSESSWVFDVISEQIEDDKGRRTMEGCRQRIFKDCLDKKHGYSGYLSFPESPDEAMGLNLAMR